MNTTSTSTAVESPGTQTSAGRAGTTLYYSLLYSAPAERQRAIDTLQFIRTISTTLYDVTEPQVAEKKIHWWHEELARLAKQSARHPACIAVQNYLYSNESVKASLKVLSAAATERYSPIATELDLRDLIVNDYSARLSLFDHALSFADAAKNVTDASAGDQPIIFQPKSAIAGNDGKVSTNDTIALGLGQFTRLYSLIERMRRGYPVFCDERYDEYKLTPDDLLSGHSNNAEASTAKQNKIKELLALSIDEAQSALEHSLTCIADTRTFNSTNLPVQIMCQIRCAQTKLWKKRVPDLLHESVSLTPVRKFIIAYRCNRRYLKKSP